MKEMYCVYMHIFPNDKVYIGITSTNPLKRWKNGFGYKGQPYLFNAIIKYGWDNIEHKILHTDLSKNEAEEKEIELIAEYQSTNKDYGYNIDNGGNSTGKHSEQTRKKISESEKGKHITREQIEKRKNTIKEKYPNGLKLSEEMKSKTSKRMIGNTYNKGIQRNKRYIEKISIKIICIETGEVFNSIIEASRKKNINKSNLHYAVCGNRKTAGGFHWKRVD